MRGNTVVNQFLGTPKVQNEAEKRNEKFYLETTVNFERIENLAQKAASSTAGAIRLTFDSFEADFFFLLY